MNPERQILAIGGATTPRDVTFFPYLLTLARRSRPRVGFLPTASGDSAAFVEKFHEHFSPFACEPTHLELFGRTPDLEEYVARQDVILVAGGNTKSMLAVWREWGLDVLLRKAWEAGTVLAGFSAGAICWFEEGLSDSWADRLAPVAGLGLLDGSFCPHYNSEPERRPAFRREIARGAMQAGIAADDGAAVYFRGTTPAAVVTVRPQAGAYAVTLRDGEVSETPLECDRIRLGAG